MTDRPQPSVLLSVDGAIATVTMNRPEKHNGIDKAMIDGLIDSAMHIRKNRQIRCVILKGEGASFCSGLDFAYVTRNKSIIPRYFIKLPWTKDNRFQRVANCWRNLPVPVIAVVHGNCFGGGIQIALGCDFRIAKPDAKMAIMEMKWGLIPDMSGMVNLSRLTREDIAKELTMTGRIFSGMEALNYGLVTEVSEEPLSRARSLAESICQQSPDAVCVAKRLIQSSWQESERKTLLLERWMQLKILFRKNNLIAMKNGLSKSAPKEPFDDRTVG